MGFCLSQKAFHLVFLQGAFCGLSWTGKLPESGQRDTAYFGNEHLLLLGFGVFGFLIQNLAHRDYEALNRYRIQGKPRKTIRFHLSTTHTIPK